MTTDHDTAEAYTILAARKVQSAEDCLRHRAHPTALEHLDSAARAITRAREALGATKEGRL